MIMRKGRHPSIQYWAFGKNDMQGKTYEKVIDRIAENGCFDTLCLSSWELNLWDVSWKPLIQDVATYANAKGIGITMQVFPKGFLTHCDVTWENAAAIVTEYEMPVEEDTLVVRAIGKNVRHRIYCRSLKSELLRAFAFRKCGDGFYEKESLVEITDRAQILHRDPESISMSFNVADLKGYTVYAMVAHYYSCIDLFSPVAICEFKELIDAYADVPLNGIVLDEFKNMTILPPWQVDQLRERIYGEHFRQYFLEQTGNDLVQTMFEMRFCPKGQEKIRMRAINQYFDVFRHSTQIVENFVAEYSMEIFGEKAMPGLHNTYHNTLQSDEIWQTCCNWWNVKRKYAQTDEDIAYPIRMGMACGCAENLVYDMYYSPDSKNYFEKTMRDARYGCRIHYHIIREGKGDSDISKDTARPEFLAAVKPYEEKIDLLNWYDPKLPEMELLVVFGFPALCNWYPDAEARNPTDINGKLNIEARVTELWDAGYLNALVPSDAILDGRITVKDGKFDYCGHQFKKMLFLYPQYSKPEVLNFLKNAIEMGCSVHILGELTHDFDGKPVEIRFEEKILLREESNLPEVLSLQKNPIPNGCRLEDGTVVLTDFESVANGTFCTQQFPVGDFACEATFRGVFALKLRADGSIDRVAAGNLKKLSVDGKVLISASGKEDFTE